MNTPAPAGTVTPNLAPDPAPAKASALTFFGVLAIAIVMGTMLLIVWKVVDGYTKASDAASVLGVIIPVFATIGAAVFGIPIAYSRGTDAGQQQANAQLPQKLEQAKQTAKSEVKATLQPSLDALHSQVTDLIGQIRTQTDNPPGGDAFQILAPPGVVAAAPQLAGTSFFTLPAHAVSDIERRFGAVAATVDQLAK